MRPDSYMGPGLRKGAWTVDEDMLLKNCIEKYGEGKWHLIPLKAGLNRCRKSCRLRWLNHLRPNIKRGEFAEDEVDLILRLHKLLGNRWALIAGRIPGRTANDVKNYWNSHHRSRSKQQKEKPNEDESLIQDTRVTAIKPQPRTLSKTINKGENIVSRDGGKLKSSNNDANNNFNMSLGLILSHNILDEDDNINQYIDDLFDDHEKNIDGKFKLSVGGSSAEGQALNVVEQEDYQTTLFDISINEVTWELINSDKL